MSAPNSYVQVWGDEFDAATLDLTKWAASGPNQNKYGQEIWDPSRVSLVNGLLQLQATADLHAGEVRSLGHWSPPLYVECSLQLPRTPGFWPGFWAVTALDSVFPYSRQEIDTAECDSSQPHRIGENLHWGTRDAMQADNGGYSDTATDFQAAQHVYGTLYLADRIEFYVDNWLRRSWTQPVPPAFSDPMQLRLSLSIFGPNQATWATPPGPATVWPQNLAVEWVRLWQPDTSPVLDATPPQVSISTPADGALVRRGKAVSILALASDNVGVAYVNWYVNGVYQAAVHSAPYLYTYSVPGKPHQSYRIEARAYDAAGNSASAFITLKSN